MVERRSEHRVLPRDGFGLDEKEDTINHFTGFFDSFQISDDWARPTLDNLVFVSIGEDEAFVTGKRF